MSDDTKLSELTAEFAAAWTDRKGHHSDRFEEETQREHDYEKQSKECRDDWHRCYWRCEHAIEALGEYLRTGETPTAETEPAPESGEVEA